MPTETRKFTKGDTLVSLFAQLIKADGSTPTLDGTVVFFMKSKKAKSADIPKVNGSPCVVVDAARREVKYDWQDEDVDTVGDYWAWFVNETGGRKEHFPGQGRYLVIKFVEAEFIAPAA